MDQSAYPIIFQSNSSPTPNLGGSARTRLIKTLLILIIIGLTGLLSYASFKLSSKFLSQNSTSFQSKVMLPISPGKIYLSSNQTTTSVGSPIDVDIKLSTGGHTVQGVDVLLKYDPKKIAPLNQNNFFAKGTIFSEYPIATTDQSKGEIRISGIASSTQIGFNGVGVFGSIRLKSLSKGTTTLSLVVTPNSMSDSNIIEYSTGQNLITAPTELDLNVN